MTELRSNFFTFEKTLEDVYQTHRWVFWLAKNKAALESIAHLIRLDTLWDWPSLHYKTKLPLMRLAYAGEAKSHDEVRKDRLVIMKALKIDHLTWTIKGQYSDTRPYLEYHGKGKLGHRHIWFVIRANWLPPGCVAHTETTEHRERAYYHRYSVSCRR